MPKDRRSSLLTFKKRRFSNNQKNHGLKGLTTHLQRLIPPETDQHAYSLCIYLILMEEGSYSLDL